jgi:hypothetical protein
MRLLLFPLFLCILNTSVAQTKSDTLKVEDEEDYSQYADVETTTSSGKRYCSQKIVGLSPAKLISVGFDFVGPNGLTTSFDSIDHYSNINHNSGVRFSANFPVISNNKMILNLGVNYLDFKYQFAGFPNNSDPLTNTLANHGLRSYGANATLFKPLNEKRFIIAQVSCDANSSSPIDEFESKYLKISGAAIYGVKPHERLQYGFGVTRTYRGGGVNYLPVILYNYTFTNKKWGIEMLLPARANVRYTFNARNMLFAGFEVEGNSYALSKFKQEYNLPYSNTQLHRSEIRPRLTYECSVYKFIWLSLQAGYRLSYKFNVDDGDNYKTISDQPYLMENSLKGGYYFNVSLNLVSP